MKISKKCLGRCFKSSSVDAELFSANNLKKITDLIGKKLHFGTSMTIRKIPLIAQLVEQRTVV